MKQEQLTLLKLADYQDPILRKATEPVQFPLSAEDKQIIQNMLYSIEPAQLKRAGAPWDAAVGMAANQWGINKRIFLFRPEDSMPGYAVIINPSYEPLSEDMDEASLQDTFWEGCFSVPLATGNVKRYVHVKVTYQNEEGETITGVLSGWPARVWQHENDHLNGFLYDDVKAGKCLQKKQFTAREEAIAFRTDQKRE